MRIERVTAHAFGPLHGESLDLAPGMTLVYGRNEAGKSSWHAALYAGLCGVRRAKGQPLADDREFREQHKPWDGERWETEVVLRLEDGRRIELRQDLAGRVACRATDIGLGIDVSAEIMFEGSPDGSRWLGLDRRVFLATACVDQAELLAVAQEPDRLQEHMQRAAATRGTDATAAEAIGRLEQVRRDQVGADTANSTKPLRRARRELEAADRALADARDRHDAFLTLSASAESGRERAAAADEVARGLAAAVASSRSVAARARAQRAADLLARHPGGPPAGLVSGDEVSQRVAAALDAWERRPSPVALSGPTADELERDLASLPTEPTGDLAPTDVVVRAKAEFDRRHEALRLLDARPTPSVRPVESMTAATAPATTGGAAAPAALWVVAGGALIGGSLILAGLLGGALGGSPGAPAVGTIGPAGWATVGIALVVVGLLVGIRAGRSGGQRTSRSSAETSALAEGLRSADEDTDRLSAWIALEADRRAAAEAADSMLLDLLAARDVDPVLGPETGYDQYLTDCRTRSDLFRQASRAAGLRTAIETRHGLEHSAAESSRRIATAEADLRQAAHMAGVDGEPAAREEVAGAGRTSDVTDDSRVAANLRAWLGRRVSAVASTEAALGEWRELETLLGGRTVQALQGEAERLTSRASELATELGSAAAELNAAGATHPAPPAADATLPKLDDRDAEHRLVELERRASTARSDAERLAGQLMEMTLGLPSVVEAEERRAAAGLELQRVEYLDRVLETTLTILRRAEERIHRDLAPILNASIAGRLPRISAGRYLEAAVNPADLAVRVKAADGGQWRDARRLSHGTREQIHLLLRVAMTEQLVTPGEIAPLLLDEVTVQSDRRRATELLDLLHDLSRERQVILFTHDERALDWARQALNESTDRLIELGASADAT